MIRILGIVDMKIIFRDSVVYELALSLPKGGFETTKPIFLIK
jgi:hypothetical protein